MAVYYVEEIKSRQGLTIGLSEISMCKTKSAMPKGVLEVNMNGVKFKDYQANPKSFYLSGNKLVKVTAESDANE